MCALGACGTTWQARCVPASPVHTNYLWHGSWCASASPSQIEGGATFSSLTCVYDDCNVQVSPSDVVRGHARPYVPSAPPRFPAHGNPRDVVTLQARAATPQQLESLDQSSLRACLATLPGYVGECVFRAARRSADCLPTATISLLLLQAALRATQEVSWWLTTTAR